MKILLAEDTRDLSRAVCAVLAHEGYEVDPAYDGEEALEYILNEGYDCILLDIMMPKMDGMQLLTEIRKRKIRTPVLMLTAKTEIEDRVAGLDNGADDYLSKPFAMKELLARIRALSRRSSGYMSEILQYGDISLNPDSFELTGKSTVRLSVKEFELMQTLMLNAENETRISYILEHVWNTDPEADENTVWLYISYLKRKLHAISSRIDIIEKEGSKYSLFYDRKAE